MLNRKIEFVICVLLLFSYRWLFSHVHCWLYYFVIEFFLIDIFLDIPCCVITCSFKFEILILLCLSGAMSGKSFSLVISTVFSVRDSRTKSLCTFAVHLWFCDSTRFYNYVWFWHPISLTPLLYFFPFDSKYVRFIWSPTVATDSTSLLVLFIILIHNPRWLYMLHGVGFILFQCHSRLHQPSLAWVIERQAVRPRLAQWHVHWN